MELLLQLLCTIGAVTWLWLEAQIGDVANSGARSVWIAALLLLAVPVLQLIPLPPQVWHALPGQADRAAGLALVGAEQSWQPMTLSPPRTVATLLALGPPLFVMTITARLDPRGRSLMIRAVVLTTLLSAGLGALQLSFGGAAFRLYPDSHSGVLTGFKANRNAQADVLLIGLVAAAAALAPFLLAGQASPSVASKSATKRHPAWIALAAISALLLLATVLIASRMGILLIPLALLWVGVILRPVVPKFRTMRSFAVVASGVVVVISALLTLAYFSPILGNVAKRFLAIDDPRRELWQDAWFALIQSWPAGVGMGGAQYALIAAEPGAPNRVHNDYLEFVLEGGVLSVAVLFAAFAWLAVAVWRNRRNPAIDRSQTSLGLAILSVIGVHSFVDYPLRSMALACLAGMGAGLLCSPSGRTSTVSTLVDQATARSGRPT
jgi:O-antigen ligase